VSKATTARPLHHIFTSVPRRYDLINRIATWRLDERWRKKAADQCLLSEPKRVLDLCCGTGDLAVHLARLGKGKIDLTGIDYSRPMLEKAEMKARLAAVADRISFVHGDAAELPFPDDHFDCIGISFSFRNLTYKNRLAKRYLSEVLRVLASGGRFVIVETSQPEPKWMRKAFHFYMLRVVYWLGYLLSHKKAAYRYLAESVSRFYDARQVKEMLLETGFRHVRFRPLFFGSICIHISVK
jgi:demethylmenaquinone methyltransferase/2-methoxy-6-polyprenyl-1,4-benzoquinol methylase